jgi:hypothetical protein
MSHVQKPDFVFRRNGRAHLNRQFSRLLAAEVCPSAVVMLDTPCSEVVWRVLATHSIRQFLLHLPSRASPCAITFQLESTNLPKRRDSRYGLTMQIILKGAKATMDIRCLNTGSGQVRKMVKSYLNQSLMYNDLKQRA